MYGYTPILPKAGGYGDTEASDDCFMHFVLNLNVWKYSLGCGASTELSDSRRYGDMLGACQPADLDTKKDFEWQGKGVKHGNKVKKIWNKNGCDLSSISADDAGNDDYLCSRRLR